MVTVHIQPDDERIDFEKLNTVLQLLNRLRLKPTSALVIRNGELLTPDRKIHSGDHITVRLVASRG